MVAERVVVAEGKTKRVWRPGPDEGFAPGEVLVESKDDITAGDGAGHDILPDKAAAATTTTCNVFALLEANGVRTHFLAQESNESFRARQLNMIPLEVVARRRAAGSYLRRYPQLTKGAVLSELVVELFEKDDAAHDPLLLLDPFTRRVWRYRADVPPSAGFIDEESLASSRFAAFGHWSWMMTLVDRTRAVFEILEVAWAGQGVVLADLKLEFGHDIETAELLLGDVVDNDSWRIWPDGDPERALDKQVYRDLVSSGRDRAEGLRQIAANYTRVAEATAAFVQPR